MKIISWLVDNVGSTYGYDRRNGVMGLVYGTNIYPSLDVYAEQSKDSSRAIGKPWIS